MDILGRSYLLITSGSWKVKSKSMFISYEQRKKTLVDEVQQWEQVFFFFFFFFQPVILCYKMRFSVLLQGKGQSLC